MSLLLAAMLWSPDAQAAPATQPFRVDNDAGSFTITQYQLPPARALGYADRTCRVGLHWQRDHLEGVDLGCPPSVAPEVLYTVGHWQASAASLSGTGPLGPVIASGAGGPQIAEVWFVYPVDWPGPPRLMVRQQAGVALSLPDDVDVAPFTIRAWTFLRYPEQAYAQGLPDVTCVVKVDADELGQARQTQAVRCPEPYAEAARTAVAGWRFEPPTVDGHPIPTGLEVATTFIATSPEREVPYTPSAESQRLWARGEYTAVSQADRIWFINAAMRPNQTKPELGPGQVQVRLPAEPDLGDRPRPSFFLPPLPPEPPALPQAPPVLHLERGQLAIAAWEIDLVGNGRRPLATGLGGRCPLLVQVDGTGQVFAWAEANCPSFLRVPSLLLAKSWVMRHDGEPIPSVRARFRAVIEYNDGAAMVVFDAADVRTPQEAWPPGIHTERAARPMTRVPPRVAGVPDAVCVLDVTVGARGRSVSVDGNRCDPAVRKAATRALGKWRWYPAERDGVPVTGHAETTIGFSPEPDEE